VYSRFPGVVLGFHGCDEAVGRAVVSGVDQLQASHNNYDWLGHGAYFWENSPSRAWEFAVEQKKRGRLRTPHVIGAILDLGNCMNLVDSQYHAMLKKAYDIYTAIIPLESDRAVNKGGRDRLLRCLDCSVFQIMHTSMESNNEPPFDSVRCAFEEGDPSFPGSGILDKTHIQICVRNPACVRGYFLPLDENGAVLKFE